MIPKRLISLCLYVAVAIYIGIGIYGAWLATQSLWPGLHEDGSLYSTIIINRSNGLGNAFSVHVTPGDLSQGTKCPSYTKFNLHGQLYYPLVSALMPGHDYDSLLRVIHFSNLMAFVLSIVLFYLLIKRVLCLSKLVILACSTGLAYAVLGILQFLQGRPEHGSVIVIVIFGLLRELFFPKRHPAWFSGILIGILVGISPLSGVYYGLFHSFCVAVAAESPKKLIFNLFTCVSVSVTTWIGLTSTVYSESLWILIINTMKTGGSINPDVFGGLLNFSFVQILSFFSMGYNPFAPFAVFSYLITFLVLAIEIWHRILIRPKFSIKTVILITVFILFLQFCYVSIIIPSPLSYNVLSFYPAVAIWLFERLIVLNRVQALHVKLKMDDQVEWRSAGLFTSATFQKFIPLFVVLLFSFPGFGSLRNLLMQTSIIANGVSYNVAKEAYQKLKSKLVEDEVVIITQYSSVLSRSAVVLDGPPWKMITHNYWQDNLDKVEAICQIKAKYLILTQIRDPFPPKIPGFYLIDDAFNRTPVKVFGRLIRSTTPGYGYAVYLRSHFE